MSISILVRALALTLLVGEPAVAGIGADPPIVVELFTSQGCSNSPPADAYLAELTGRRDVLALGFHVDYWNYAGWTDPMSAEWASERQREYRRTLGIPFVYTPQMVVNGADENVGADRPIIEALIRNAAQTRPRHPDLSLDLRPDGALAVRVTALERPYAPAVLWLVGYDRPRRTHILAGENQGRVATDYHAVRHFERLGTWTGEAFETVVPREAARALGTGGAAVLLQEDDVGQILTAAQVEFPTKSAAR